MQRNLDIATMKCVGALVLPIVLLGALLAWAAPAARHSGTIMSVAADGSFVLGEVGPWQIRGGQTVVTPLTVRTAPQTAVVVARRAEGAASGFAGDFVESPFDLSVVAAGRFVTVECRAGGPSCVAAKITLIEPETR